MDLNEKISVLGPNAQYDTCGPKDFGLVTDIPGVYRANVGGRVCRIYKVLQTNTCKNNCRYCALRRDRDIPRVVVTPDDLAKSFVNVYSRRLVEGFFLSSAIIGNADQTMQMLIDTATIVRNRYAYKGYLHLKIMPDSSSRVIREALNLASRVSLNIESPTEESLANLSPFAENLGRKPVNVQPSQPKRLLRRSRQCEEISASARLAEVTAKREGLRSRPALPAGRRSSREKIPDRQVGELHLRKRIFKEDFITP